MKERGYPFHQVTIVRIESGDRRLTIGEAQSLSRVLGVSLQELAGDLPAPASELRGKMAGAADLIRQNLREMAELFEDTRALTRILDTAATEYDEAVAGQITPVLGSGTTSAREHFGTLLSTLRRWERRSVLPPEFDLRGSLRYDPDRAELKALVRRSHKEE
jgi:hypothetical protein